MDKKSLNIDTKLHIPYSNKIERIIRDRLSKHLDSAKVECTFEKIQLKYAEFLEDLPYLGGKHCRHNGPGGTYDCIMIFAYYEVMEPKPSIEELYNMNNEAFLPAFERLGKIGNLNKRWQRKVINKVFEVTARADKKWEDKCPTSYIMRVEPFDDTKGVRYKFHRCPIAEFAKAHGYTDIMPAFCNGDYPAMELLKARLIRESTCSNGDYCDYLIVGNESDLAKQFPEEVDSQGYRYNPINNKHE